MFQSSEEMLVVVCMVTYAVVWPSELIKLCASPSTAHLRAYNSCEECMPLGHSVPDSREEGGSPVPQVAPILL